MNVKQLLDLTGKVSVVTGGTGFYGKPISEGLAEAGSHVVIASRNRQRCQDWALELEGRGYSASADGFDQGSESSTLDFCERVWRKFGAVDVLVNNSVARPMRAYTDPLQAWERSMAVNATGVFAISRAFVDRMMERGQGAVVNIGSIQSVVAPTFTNYAGTDMTTPPDYHFHKHGMIGLTKYLAAWAGPQGVRVNAIAPGGLASGRREGALLVPVLQQHLPGPHGPIRRHQGIGGFPGLRGFRLRHRAHHTAGRRLLRLSRISHSLSNKKSAPAAMAGALLDIDWNLDQK